MIKRIVKIGLFIVLSCLFFGFTVSAAEKTVNDEADLFSASEISDLEDEMEAAAQELDMDVLVLTTDDTSGQTTSDYADSYFLDYKLGRGTEESCVMLVLDMDNREIYIYTHGLAQEYFVDTRIEAMLDNAYDDVSAEDYYSAAMGFLSDIKSYYQQGVPENGYYYDEETGKTSGFKLNETPLWILSVGCLIAALLTGAVFYAIVSAKYKSGGKSFGSTSRPRSALQLTKQEDAFVNQTISKTHIPRNNSSSGGGSGGGGGRSTAHTSSRGHSHGGGGRKF